MVLDLLYDESSLCSLILGVSCVLLAFSRLGIEGMDDMKATIGLKQLDLNDANG